MQAELLATLAEIDRTWDLLRADKGNPNHKGSGAGGGQFTSGQAGGGSGSKSHGKHHAKRQRRKKKLEKLRQQARREAKAMRREHRGQRKSLLKDQRHEWSRVQREHKSELASHHKAVQGERTKLLTAQSGERASLLKSYKDDPAEAKAQGVAGIKKELASLRGEQKAARKELVATHGKRLADIKESHGKELADLKDEHREYRGDVRKDQADEKKLFVKEFREQLGKEFPGRRKARGLDESGDSVTASGRTNHESTLFTQRSEAATDPTGRRDDASGGPGSSRRAWIGHDGSSLVARRFHSSKTHKANSDTAIRDHILRGRGWTAQWRRGELTGRQHLSLLEDCRQYGRQWMRHEAERFFDEYGVEDETRLDGSQRGISGIPDAILGRERRSDATKDQEPVLQVARGIASRAAGALGRFFDRSKQFVRELIFSGAMLLKGNESFTTSEEAALNRQVSVQAGYLDRFKREVESKPPKEIADLSNLVIAVEPPPMTPGQFIARAEQYGNAVWEVQNVGREIVRKQEVFSAERRIHDKPPGHHECRTCIEQSALGWQPLGTLKEIGDSECGGNCDCYFLWQDPKGAVHVSPWGRHNPKGFEQQPAIPALPSGPGPKEKPPRKIKLKPKQPFEPKPKPAISDNYPPPRPLQTLKELLEEAESPYAPEEYEEA